VSRHAVVREARPQRPAAGSSALRIDPSVCDGVGICAHLAPDLVTVDSWGYPIVRAGVLGSASERRQAEAAVAACPRRALRVTG
jgi:ferredoxin